MDTQPILLDEVYIDETFENNDKINCTYNQLVKDTSIKDILVDFFGEDAMNDVTFKVEEDLICNGSSKASGCTRKLTDNTYEILIDKTYINNPKTPTIFLAQTIIHEAIHANLFAAVVKLNNGTLPVDTNFAALYEQYRSKKHWSHEYMADYYTGIMQNAIKEVHPRLNDKDFFDWSNDNANWDWDEFYEYISYRGLDETEAGAEYFDNTDNLSLYKEGAESLSTKIPNCK